MHALQQLAGALDTHTHTHTQCSDSIRTPLGAHRHLDEYTHTCAQQLELHACDWAHENRLTHNPNFDDYKKKHALKNKKKKYFFQGLIMDKKNDKMEILEVYKVKHVLIS